MRPTFVNVTPPFQRFRRRPAFPENRPSTRWRISIVREMRSVFITRPGLHLMSQLCDLWLEPHRLDYASCRWLPRERSTSAVIVLVRACIRASVSFFGCLNNMTDCLRHIQDLNGNYAWLSACLWLSMLSARGSCLVPRPVHLSLLLDLIAYVGVFLALLFLSP